jgi:hypothetical protein
MKEYSYNPFEEARNLGLTIKFAGFKKLNSFLIEKVVYLRENMNRIEKRCSLTYEIVHFNWIIYSKQNQTFYHSKKVEDILRQQTARKLICPDKLYKLMESNYDHNTILEELEVTNDVLVNYFKYCKIKNCTDNLISSIQDHPFNEQNLFAKNFEPQNIL